MEIDENNIVFRPARLEDIPAMLELLEPHVQHHVVLRRTPEDLALCIKNFVLACDNATGRLCGLGALRPYGDGIFEVRSLAVDCTMLNGGIGSKLVRALIEKGRTLVPPAQCIFALTKRPDFFQHMGFIHASKDKFPEKIWADCRQCPNYSCCDEVAMEYCPARDCP